MKILSRDPTGTTLHHAPVAPGSRWVEQHGLMTLEAPPEIVAGSPTELQFEYTSGKRSLEPGDRLGIAWRLPCDWGEPQFERPDLPGFVSARPPAGVTLDLEYQPNGGVKPWHHLFVATLVDGSVAAENSVRFIFGDRSQGCIGWESQTAIANSLRFMPLIRRRTDDHWIELNRLASLRIVGGRPTSLSLTAASDCAPGAPIDVTLRLADEWGNPSMGFSGGFELMNPDLRIWSTERLRRNGDEYDVWHVRLSFERPGLHRVSARVPELGLSAQSNPIECREPEGQPRLLWGDLHGGQCELGCGQGNLADYFWYARFVAGLQFASHQANDVYVSREDWQHTREVTAAADAPGDFTAFLGCEWTAQPDSGGDRNVFYLEDRPVLHRADRWYAEDTPDDWPDARKPRDLYRFLTDTEALMNLHAGGYPSDLNYHDPRLEGLVEVHSTHGTSDWLVEEALGQGRVIGVSAGTDGITGRPGASAPGRRYTRNLPNGCFGLYSPGNSREEIWESIRARRCYGTDGERMRLMVRLDGHPMGASVKTSGAPLFEVEVAGTAPLERVILRRGTEIVAVEELWTEDAGYPHRFRVLWCGTRRRGTGRDQLLDWTGSLTCDEGGSLRLVGPVGYYGHLDDVLQRDDRTVTWRSATAGNNVGFLFDASITRSTVRFESAVIEFECSLPTRGAMRQELPPERGRGSVTISRAPSERGAREALLTVGDDSAPRGRHAYWVEVVQTNGSRAWSSPIYATVD